MLPLHGRPLMEWVILPLLAGGIRDFVVALSYLGDQVENYFRDGARWGAHIEYSRNLKPAGKAGEIWRARDLLPAEDPFLVVPGDTICHLNYRELISFHQEHKSQLTVAFSTRYRLEVGTARIDERGLVREFREKSNLEEPVSTGAYLMDSRIYPYIEESNPKEREVDLPADVFRRLLRANTPFYGYVSDYAWWDVGRISDYEALFRLTAGEAAKILPWES